jgi:hypothetical protein
MRKRLGFQQKDNILTQYMWININQKHSEAQTQQQMLETFSNSK